MDPRNWIAQTRLEASKEADVGMVRAGNKSIW